MYTTHSTLNHQVNYMVICSIILVTWMECKSNEKKKKKVIRLLIEQKTDCPNPIYKWIFPFHFGFCHFFPTQTRTKTVHVFPLFEIHRFYTKSDSKNKKHFFFTYFRFEQQMEKKKYMVKTFAHFGKSRELCRGSKMIL